MPNYRRAFTAAFFTVPLLYLATCFYINSRLSSGFVAVELGDSEEILVDKMGQPAIRTSTGVGVPRYGKGCEAPCATRWWYENRLMLDLTAWSVDIDASGKVIHKTLWSSP